ncbi:MAG: cysteine--tRNA ligase [Candidatus Latescibacteria bacterium]|nr:cysteine--tRNA ligase [Candidatus Latescibacterota bacterium]NIM22566.1 cysteine--tRNA ligase [Candidatus Latescibacterota bacterium]NIM64855.1 cysteine--tRNA ligase [Candidatus Latescibacterota bacterium]NIO01370.1 cysteine--tRNA ligase [Candidatus Latescibacterota bacterium]NIO27880.1 cysteine--tRNA ligase [Candidatus Latescibacterota bacterium]
MALRVYDTLRGEKREFEPIEEGKVGIYFCGMTVQDKPHMGHMLAFVAGDMIRRYLEYKGYDVTYIQNFTDIDDKIIDKAKEEGCDYLEIAERNIKAYFESANALNIKDATIFPRATEHIQEIVDLIRVLEEKGYAYQAGRDVYYRVRAFANYGKLSKRKIDDLKSGARIEVGEEKEDPLDFALWKGADPSDPGWDSPWGRGRPGWHIECSAMSMKYLGNTLDFHGGGEDLIFPHHENELAQSEGATGCDFVHFWLHNGLLNLSGEKMSKSTGHFFAMEDVLREFDGDVVRFYLLSTHFRSQSEFSRDRLEEARRGFERLQLACMSIEENLGKIGSASGVSAPAGEQLKEAAAKAKENFIAAMDDDFNSAGAIGAVFELVRAYNKLLDENAMAIGEDREALEEVKGTILEFDSVLGLFKMGLPGKLEAIPPEITALVDKRQEARKAKDFATADALREEIERAGYVIEDRPDGARVRKK